MASFFRKTAGRISLIFLLPSLLTGCTLLQLREETQILQNSTILVGTVSSPLSFPDTPVIVAAYSKKGKTRTIVHDTRLHEVGPYELIVPKAKYHVVAFADKNRNLVYDAGEPAGEYPGAEGVLAPAGGVIGDINILIPDLNAGEIDLPVGTAMPPGKSRMFHSTAPGAIADLDDTLFSAEYGKKGFWAPLEFYKDIGGNIYFLEPYDPEKIPILFVHGAAGSPQDWRAFFERIDKDRFQPWFYYYPSGSSLNSMSHLLFWKLLNLQSKYQFKELYITAHSLGGLIVRSFLVNSGQMFPSITHFITLSTPWGGEEFAESGVKYSPAVIPAWRDMQPQGEFIESIFSKDLPLGVEHFLLFGHKGNRSLLRPNNDKSVTLASLLDQRSQREAKMVYGFDEDHVSILSSEQVLSQYTAILDAAYEKTKHADSAPGNKLRVDFSFDFPEELPRPQIALLLRSVDEKRAETWLFLDQQGTGQEHGPFPSGEYEVSLFASAFVPEPVSRLISIEEGTVSSVQFLMKPRGCLKGYVVASTKNSVKQAGTSPDPDAEVPIQSITVKGAEITRTLTPLKEENSRYSDHYLSGTDFAADGTFFFFGLPAGEYELTVNAKGYQPYSEVRQVRPGQFESVVPIELVEEEYGAARDRDS